MKQATLRGFDYLATNLDDQLRFCNPLLSFDSGERAEIFLARNLDWSYEPNDQHRSLILVEEDQLATFATVDSDLGGPILPGQGVVLMGHQFAAAIGNARIELEDSKLVRFRQPSLAPYSLAVTDIATYETYANQLITQAKKAFDDECNTRSSNTISKRGKAALFILSNCGMARSTDLALRQLAAAFVFPEPDNYRRLLIRFSIELDETEDTIHDRVMRHLYIGASHRKLRHINFPADLGGKALVSQASQQWIQLRRSQSADSLDPVLWPKSDGKSRTGPTLISSDLFAPFQARDDSVKERWRDLGSYALDLSPVSGLTSPDLSRLSDPPISGILSELSLPNQRKEVYQEQAVPLIEKNIWAGWTADLIRTEVVPEKNLGYNVVGTPQNTTSVKSVVSTATKQSVISQKHLHFG